jgi:transposase
MVRRTVAAVHPRKPTNDAEAICTAVIQPTMRFVPVKTEVKQTVLMGRRARDFLVHQLTRLANAIRGHLGEFGLCVPKGVHNMGRLCAEAEAAELPAGARMPLERLVGHPKPFEDLSKDEKAEYLHFNDLSGTAVTLRSVAACSISQI